MNAQIFEAFISDQKVEVAGRVVESYKREPHRVHKLLLQLDESGELLELIADIVRQERDNAPLVKPQGEIVEREGWQI